MDLRFTLGQDPPYTYTSSYGSISTHPEGSSGHGLYQLCQEAAIDFTESRHRALKSMSHF